MTKPVDTVKLRASLGLSQREFAERYHMPLRTLQNWEQGLREPRGPARLLLRVIAAHPDLVALALRKK